MADPEVELLAAALRRDSADLDLYGAVLTAEICHEVRDVVLSRRPVGLDEWLAALAQELSRAAASNARARTAVERFLT
ncbi:hypothetical protein [Streptomyces vinaceus]|uniref:hypothetical protein n=1 Tax=Streptomyces vinaceus TaxID=1960 RepID=UPI00368CA298